MDRAVLHVADTQAGIDLGLPALLQAPSALEALRLGLEGSRQRKDRMKRESKEKERMDRVLKGKVKVKVKATRRMIPRGA